VPQKAGRVRASRLPSDLGGYQPIDFSSLPVGPDFDLVDGLFGVDAYAVFAITTPPPPPTTANNNIYDNNTCALLAVIKCCKLYYFELVV